MVCTLLLFVLAGVFFGGDIGKTRDDYTWAVNDPATGAIAVADLWRLPLFWRPLSLVLVRHVVSLTWDAPAIANLLAALSYLGLCVATWRWVRGLGFVLGAGAITALLLTLPMAFDVMHWPAAIPTALAGIIVVLVAHRVMRSPKREVRPWPRLGMACVVFAACCFNEQAVACLGGVALAPMCANLPPRTRLRRSALLALAIGVPSALYVLLVAVTSPSTNRGGVSTLLPLGDWFGRTATVGEQTWSQLGGVHGRDLTLRGIEVGLANLGMLGFLVLALAVLSGCFWAIRTWVVHASDDRPATGMAVSVGVGWFALGLVPFIVVKTGPIEARHVVLPAIGLLIACVAVLELASRGLPVRVASVARRGTTCLVLLIAGAGAVSLVGIQATLKDRYRLDLQEARAIAELFPDPQPGAVILVARSPWRAADTGRRQYDRRFWSAWQMDHIATAVLRHQYGRGDIFAKHRFSMAFGVAAEDISEQGWTTGLSDGPAWDGGKLPPSEIAWDRILAVRFEPDGTAVPIDTLRFVRDRQVIDTIALPSVGAASADTELETFRVRIR